MQQIKQTNANGVLVSTVKLFEGLFETIVFDTHHTFERRSRTYEQAMNDHAAGIEYAKGLKQ